MYMYCIVFEYCIAHMHHQSKISIKQYMFSLASLKYAKIIYAHCCAKLALLRSILKRFAQALPSGHVLLSHLIRLHPEDVTFPLPVEAGDCTGIQPVETSTPPRCENFWVARKLGRPTANKSH